MSRSARFGVAAAVVLLAGAAAVGLYLGAKRPTDGIGVRSSTGSKAGYVDTRACQPCHLKLYRTYHETGMGRSFYRYRSELSVEDWTERNTLHHEASDRRYTMSRRGEEYFQRRHQVAPDGSEANVVEKEIHFVLGSGNHARSYLHLDSAGRLFELPVTWYRESGGSWGMSPGYDRPLHHDFRRRVTYECLFCHTGYPDTEPGGDQFGRESLFRGTIPEGIDCQRCHGPGGTHIDAVQTAGATTEAIRASIVNPARLAPERQLEVCLQCHLETTSARLPPYLHRLDRGVLSYRPGEPLADYVLHFDHRPGTGFDDKFEIVNAAYRLRRSACFTSSAGALTCTTCHNPHDVPRGEAAARHYSGVCQKCHGSGLESLAAAGRHPRDRNCVPCHMPKRRTDDVVHVVMTDHLIQRRKPARDLVAPLAEKHFYDRPYSGDVVPYYPAALSSVSEGESYLALAQVRDGSNRKAGIQRLEQAIAAQRPARPEFHYELGRAYAEEGEYEKAVAAYGRALEGRPDFWAARERLGLALLKLGRNEQARSELERAAQLGIEQATTLSDLALAYRNLGKLDDARAALEKALRADPELPDLHNNLGGVLLEKGEEAAAEAAFRNAIRIQPDFAAAHHSLAKLLAGRQSFSDAASHFEQAIRYNPALARAHHDYARMLAHLERYDRAQTELETAARLEPDSADVHNALGEVLALRGNPRAAMRELRRAVELDPDHHQAHFNLGNALLIERRLDQALLHLEKAAQSQDSELRKQALNTIRGIAPARSR